MRLDIEKVNDPSGFIVDGKLRVVFVFLIHLSMLFIIGLALEGAAWSTDKLVLNDGEAVRLSPSQIRWVQLEEAPKGDLVSLPVYLNNDRSDVLFTIDLPFDSTAGTLVAMRAVCLTAGG
jgi:dynein heavy chain 1